MRDIGIFILTYPGDWHLCKILAQSIRYFCGEVPIVIIKDGDFSISQLQALGNVYEFDNRCVPEPLRKVRGWGLPKLQVFFEDLFERFLYLDADICLVNNVLDLSFRSSDFYADTAGMAPPLGESRKPWQKRGPFPCWVKRYTFDPAGIAGFDPEFRLDDLLLLNSGQFFGRPGLLLLDDIMRCVPYWQNNSGLFSCADQGIVNYLLNKGHQRGDFVLDGEPFRIIGSLETEADYPGLTRETLLARCFAERSLIHWAGINRPRLSDLPFGFVLEEFEDRYYEHFPFWVRLEDRLLRSAYERKETVLNRGSAIKHRLLSLRTALDRA